MQILAGIFGTPTWENSKFETETSKLGGGTRRPFWLLVKHYFEMVQPGIFFQFRFPLSSEILQTFMAMNFLVLSYLIVPRKQLFIQHDAMNTKVGCYVGITKQFLRHFFHSSEIKDNCLNKIWSEVYNSQKL